MKEPSPFTLYSPFFSNLPQCSPYFSSWWGLCENWEVSSYKMFLLGKKNCNLVGKLVFLHIKKMWENWQPSQEIKINFSSPTFPFPNYWPSFSTFFQSFCQIYVKRSYLPTVPLFILLFHNLIILLANRIIPNRIQIKASLNYQPNYTGKHLHVLCNIPIICTGSLSQLKKLLALAMSKLVSELSSHFGNHTKNFFDYVLWFY